MLLFSWILIAGFSALFLALAYKAWQAHAAYCVALHEKRDSIDVESFVATTFSSSASLAARDLTINELQDLLESIGSSSSRALDITNNAIATASNSSLSEVSTANFRDGALSNVSHGFGVA